MLSWAKELFKNFGRVTAVFVAIGAITAYFGGWEKLVTYYDNYEVKHALPFKPAEYGVLVCIFDGETEYKNYVSKNIANILNARFRELGLKTATAKRDQYIFSSNIPSKPGEANALGQKYDADLVVWGSVSEYGIISNIRIVDNSEQFSMYPDKEITIFKETLQNVSKDNISNNIRFAGRRPELTDETVALVSFAVAINYKKNGNFNEAIKFFRRSIPLDKTKYIRNEPTYTQIAMCYYSLGNFKAAEETILKHIRYQENSNLLAFIGMLRYLRDSIPPQYHKQLAQLWMHSLPRDWEFLDRLFMYGLTEKIVVKHSKRKKDKVDKIITKALTNPSPTKSRSWKFLQLLYAQEHKDYELFKKTYTELFGDADLDERMILALQAISVDIDLAEDSINRIRTENGIFPALSLLEAYKYMLQKKYNQSRKVIEMTQVLKEKSLLGRTILSAYYSEEGDYEKALTYLDELVEDLPSAAFYRKLRGDINYYFNKRDKAEEDYKIYIKEYSKDVKILYRLSTLATLRKDTDSAQNYIKRMLECPRDHDFKFYPIIENLISNNSISISFDFIDSAHKDLLIEVFRFVNTNDIETAKKRLFDAIIGTSENKVGSECSSQCVSLEYYVAALVNFLDGDFPEGYRYLLNSYAAYPTDEVLNIFNLVAQKIGNVEISSSSEFAPLFATAASAFKSRILDKNYSEAAGYFETASKRYPDFCFLMQKVGTYRFLAKNYKDAVKNYRIALQCEPRMKNVNSMYATILIEFFKEPDCKNAIRYFQQSLEVDGESVAAYDGLEQCYEKLGDKEKAKEFHNKYRNLYFKNGGSAMDYGFRQPFRHL